MKITRILALVWGAAPAFGLAACHDDEPSFLPLVDLCDVYAEEVCDARQACCDGFDRDVCETSVRGQCKADSAQLSMEAELSYDGKWADRVRQEMRDKLPDCVSLPLGAFFVGTKGAGEACERPGQCESLSCAAAGEGSPMVCSDPATYPVCDPADI